MALSTPKAVIVAALLVVIVALGYRISRRVRKYSKTKTFLRCVLDGLLEFVAYFEMGLWSKVNIDTSMWAAKLRTGVSDLGGSEKSLFLKVYDMVLTRGLERAKVKFSPVGSIFAQVGMFIRTKFRLELIDFLKKHPSIKEVQLKPPVFVMGLTRTGTTFLHELLEMNDQFQSHRTWEQVTPVPMTDNEDILAQEKDRTWRYHLFKLPFNFTFNHLMHEKMQHIHRAGYDLVEECTTPCSYELPWTVLGVPLMAYCIDELLPLGAGDVYTLYRSMLQLYTWQSKDRRGVDFRWMLKCPFHLPYLKELLTAFPGATIVWTHRDPAECIASACSLFEGIFELFMEEESIDRIQLGQVVLHYSKVCIQTAEDTLASMVLPEGTKIVHIRYKDTINQPKSTCEKVLHEVGVPYTDAYNKRLDAYLQASYATRDAIKAKKHSEVVHVYQPEDYGLTKEGIREDFHEYIAKYRLLE